MAVVGILGAHAGLQPLLQRVEDVGPIHVVEDQVKTLRVAIFCFVPGAEFLIKRLDLGGRGKDIVWSVEEEDRQVDFPGRGLTVAHHFIDCAEQSQGEKFHIMRGVFHLLLVGGGVGHFHLAIPARGR
jgi:hypothetical protein